MLAGANHQDTSRPSEFTTSASAPRPLQNPDMNILVVDTPNQPKRFSDTGILDAFEDASERIEFATDGAASLDSHITIDHISATPTGVGEAKGSQQCFTGEQTRQFHDRYRVAKKLGENSVVSVVYTSTADCSLNRNFGGAAGYATSSQGYPYFVLNSSLQPTVHEMGHVWGLPHGKRINTVGVKGSYNWTDTMSLVEPHYELFREFVGGKPLTPQEMNQKQEYSSNYTVMGSANMKANPMLFTVEELAVIAPNRFKILDVPAQQGDYELTMSEGGYAGIRMPLPADHSLKQIDPGINAITFGLSVKRTDRPFKAITSVDDPNAQMNLVVSARGEHGTYTLGMSAYPMRASSLGNSEEASLYREHYRMAEIFPSVFDRNIVYMDKTNDIVVMTYRNYEGKTMINVGNAASTAEHRTQLKGEYEKRQRLLARYAREEQEAREEVRTRQKMAQGIATPQ